MFLLLLWTKKNKTINLKTQAMCLPHTMARQEQNNYNRLFHSEKGKTGSRKLALIHVILKSYRADEVRSSDPGARECFLIRAQFCSIEGASQHKIPLFLGSGYLVHSSPWILTPPLWAFGSSLWNVFVFLYKNCPCLQLNSFLGFLPPLRSWDTKDFFLSWNFNNLHFFY